MKRCVSCKTLCSSSTKVCRKCGSKDLESGFYNDEPDKGVIFNRDLKKSKLNKVYCPTCSAPITITGFSVECNFCGDEISSDGTSFYGEYIDRLPDK